MVELKVDDKLIDMMNVETFPVVFKLLGTLRMLLDKQGLYVGLFLSLFIVNMKYLNL